MRKPSSVRFCSDSLILSLPCWIMIGDTDPSEGEESDGVVGKLDEDDLTLEGEPDELDDSEELVLEHESVESVRL